MSDLSPCRSNTKEKKGKKVTEISAELSDSLCVICVFDTHTHIHTELQVSQNKNTPISEK